MKSLMYLSSVHPALSIFHCIELNKGKSPTLSAVTIPDQPQVPELQALYIGELAADRLVVEFIRQLAQHDRPGGRSRIETAPLSKPIAIIATATSPTVVAIKATI